MGSLIASKLVPINGLEIYCEVYGTGQPLILIHGGFGVVGMFEQLLPQVIEDRQVIAVELQAHGHTADIDRPLSYEFMADDIAALIQYFGFAHADVLGYSLGGGVALQTVIRHSERVRKVVVISAPCKSDGWYPEVLAGQRSINSEVAKTWVGSPMHQAYMSVAPHPEDWTSLAAKTGRLFAQDDDGSKDISSINTPLRIVVGDADAIRPSHTVEFFKLLGGGKMDAGWDGSGMPNSRLAILPATTHYNILSSPLLAPIVNQFLEASMP